MVQQDSLQSAGFDRSAGSGGPVLERAVGGELDGAQGFTFDQRYVRLGFRVRCGDTGETYGGVACLNHGQVAIWVVDVFSHSVLHCDSGYISHVDQRSRRRQGRR